MAAQAVGLDPSERIFTELRSRNDEVKQRAAHELKDLVNLLSRGKTDSTLSMTNADIV